MGLARFLVTPATLVAPADGPSPASEASCPSIAPDSVKSMVYYVRGYTQRLQRGSGRTVSESASEVKQYIKTQIKEQRGYTDRQDFFEHMGLTE